MLADGIANMISNLLLFGIVVLFRRLVHKEGLKAFLLQTDKRGGYLFLEGIIVGFLFFMLYPIIMVISGKGQVYFSSAGIKNTLVAIFALGIGYISVALFEEALFRGYILQRLLKILPSYAAIIISSMIFGGLHFFAYSPSKYFWIGLINASFIGMILSVIVIKTKSLMLALGYHFVWNLTQDILFMNYSYNHKFEALMNVKIHESLWTGTPNTPEAGLIVTFILVLMSAYVYIRFINQRKNVAMEV